MTSFNVIDYSVQIHSDANNPSAYNPVIGLNIAVTGQPSNTAVAFLYFYPETTTTLPSNSVQIQGSMRVYSANFRRSWFSTLIDLLRNEKPLTFWFDTSSKEVLLGTGSQEPVGEAEK